MTSISGLGTSNLLDAGLLKAMKVNGQGGAEADLPMKETPAAQPGAVDADNISFTSTSKNMMAGNFVSSGSVEDHQSTYIRARQAGQNAVDMQGSQQNAILNSAMAELGTIQAEGGGYAKLALIGNRAARRMMDERNQASMEASKHNLDKQKESIEERADNATGVNASDDSSQTDVAQAIPAEKQANMESEAAQPVSAEQEATALESAKPASPDVSIDIVV